MGRAGAHRRVARGAAVPARHHRRPDLRGRPRQAARRGVAGAAQLQRRSLLRDDGLGAADDAARAARARGRARSARGAGGRRRDQRQAGHAGRDALVRLPRGELPPAALGLPPRPRAAGRVRVLPRAARDLDRRRAGALRVRPRGRRHRRHPPGADHRAAREPDGALRRVAGEPAPGARGDRGGARVAVGLVQREQVLMQGVLTTTTEERRRLFKASPARALLVAGLIPEAVAAQLRERVRPLLRPYWLADQGRYQVDETHLEPVLFAGLAELAAEIVDVKVTPGRARWTRLVRGDYAMYKNDSRLWRGMDRHLEVVLDFSAAETSEAQIVYTTPAEVFWMPQQPLCGALVDRRQQIQRYDRYLTHRVRDAEVFRL